ncbi:AMMECR1 domain-containing protein [Salix suchowensis]|nr:AMMECR1 domain-containing protein [Salix suchowensis]
MHWNFRSSVHNYWIPGLCFDKVLLDRRFPPIQAKELPTRECTVSILTDYETADHYLDWEVGKHGLIIEFTDPNNNARRSATYLPEVAR